VLKFPCCHREPKPSLTLTKRYRPAGDKPLIYQLQFASAISIASPETIEMNADLLI